MPESRRLARCKPSLGTLVEMSCLRRADLSLHIFDGAFAAVARVHDLMSVQSKDSDLSRLNRARLYSWVEVDEEVALVLDEAQQLAEQSGQIFNPCFGSAHSAACAYQVERGRARRLKDCRIDLSGIAKGYAVDRAVSVLEAAGATEILVNAGGDMRHLGREPLQVAVRDVADPTRHQGVALLCNAALASSVNRRLGGDGLDDTATVCDGRDGGVLAQTQGASVIAPSAILADVLAKVMLIEPMAGAILCDRYAARRVSFEPHALA
jgi:thiamine biosynthesis lipoprotein